MNKKGFTLVELIAVVVIMSIIALIATPNVIALLERGKKQDFVSDAKEFASKANYMFERREQKNYSGEIIEYDPTDESYKILLSNIEGIENLDSPFGGKYTGYSYVVFKKNATDTEGVYKYDTYIKLISCTESNPAKCYYTGSNDNEGEVLVSKLKLENIIGPKES